MFVCNIPNGLGCGDGEFSRVNVDKPAPIRNRRSKLSVQPVPRLTSRKYDHLGLRKYHSKCVPLCKKAKSLENLSANQNLNILRSKSLLAVTSTVGFSMANKTHSSAATLAAKKENNAARRIYEALLLNAWRRRRLQAIELSEKLDNLKTQKESFHLHMAFLRTLLDTERKRVTQYTNAAQQMALEVEEVKRQREETKKEKKLLEKEIEQLEETVEDLNTKYNNYKNDLLASRTEITLMESQLAKEREKLVKLREDKKILIEKLQATEDIVTEKDEVVESLQESKNSLEHQLQAEREMLRLAESENEDARRTIEELNERKEKLEAEMQEARRDQQNLRKLLQEREALLAKKERQCASLRASVEGHRMEIRHMQERILQQTQANGESWRERALTYFARIPLSLFRGGVSSIFGPNVNT